jgi:SNF2 family DNA or RNA helicase
MSSPLPLAKHQTEGIDWIRQVRRGLLGDEPGLGKSRVAIEAFKDAKRVLVVAPSMVVAGGTWAEEIEKWDADPNKFVVAPYSMLNARVKTGARGTKPVKQLRPEYLGSWDALIVDEAHYTKGRSTSWTWAVEEISKRSSYVLEMTGTPMPNWAYELFTLLRVIWPDEAQPGRKYGSYWRWVEEWFQVSPSPFSSTGQVIGGLRRCSKECSSRPPLNPCEHFQEFAAANLGNRFLRRLRDECLDLPPLTTQVVRVEMNKNQKRLYRELKQELVTTTDSGAELVAWTSGSKQVMLDRLTTSDWMLDPKTAVPSGGKFDQLRFDLENRSRPTLVLAHYRQTVEACVAVAQSMGLTAAAVHGGISEALKSQAIADFKAGRLEVLVGSLETLAEGLTLTVADMAIFVEMSYKPSRNEQARYRVHRMGQTRPVTVKEYVTVDTLDQRKRVLLGQKTDQQMRVLSAAEFRELV